FDHAVSVTMYTALAMAAGLVAGAAGGEMDPSLETSPTQSLLGGRKNAHHRGEKIGTRGLRSPNQSGRFFGGRGRLAQFHGGEAALGGGGQGSCHRDEYGRISSWAAGDGLSRAALLPLAGSTSVAGRRPGGGGRPAKARGGGNAHRRGTF